MAKEFLLTAEGLKQMEAELDYLKSEKMLEVAQKIKEARSFGDLSENSEYDAAKNEQAQVQEKIVKLENMLKHATVIEEDASSSGTITIGAKVKLHDIEYDEDVEYTIVGSNEANPSQGKISNESPVGKGLLGKKAGQTVEIEAPQGIISFKILKVKK